MRFLKIIFIFPKKILKKYILFKFKKKIDSIKFSYFQIKFIKL
jgi:hypothetical protein